MRKSLGRMVVKYANDNVYIYLFIFSEGGNNIDGTKLIFHNVKIHIRVEC